MYDQFAALDVEATGMDPAKHEIIEVAVVVFSREREIERYQTTVKPRRRIKLDTASLTGIDPAELTSAPSFDQIAPTLRRLLAGRPVIGHSVELDVAMLEASGVRVTTPILDTFHLATVTLPDLPNYSLRAVATALGVEIGEGHRALADAEAASAVFRALHARLETFDESTLRRVALLASAAGWASGDLFATIADRRLTGPLFAAAADETTGPHELAFLVPREKPEPLRRTGSKAPIAEDRVMAALRGGGALAAVAPWFEHRPAQEAMALAVARALNDDGRLLVEAGTGTGKSIAYLLPAVLHARERGETVVVSTNTLALQDQLYRKDIPDLQRALAAVDGGESFAATTLKGRSNYLCPRRWFAAQRQPLVGPAEAGMRAKVILWLSATESGDRAELRLSPDEESEFRRVSAEGEACQPATCLFQQRNQCFLYRARREAEHAHVVVVNHALLLSDTVEGAKVLPDFEHLIVDEAHHLEDQATTQFGFSVGEGRFDELLDQIVRADGSGGLIQRVVQELTGQATDERSRQLAANGIERLRRILERVGATRAGVFDLFGRLRALMEQRAEPSGGYDRTLRLIPGVRRTSEWGDVEIAWERVDRDVRDLESDLGWFLEALDRVPFDESQASADDPVTELTIEVTNVLRESMDARAQLAEIAIDPKSEAVYWLERDAFRGALTLRAAPLHVGALLRERVYDPLRTVVMTSATLTTDGAFDFVRERLGFEHAAELAVASPFDYERSTLLFLADDMPEPNAPGYQQALQETLVELGAAMGGRILVLFTSHAALQATHRAIRGPLEEHGVIALAQRSDGSARQLIDRLRHNSNVMVLGTSTFWEGVDVVGSALSALVIAKLPFAVPSDPVFAARSEGFDEPFVQYAVPQAVLKFKQGFGRLIRSTSDRGVCAVLDRRVISKRYGSSFVQSLPSCAVRIGSAAELAAEAAAWCDTTYPT